MSQLNDQPSLKTLPDGTQQWLVMRDDPWARMTCTDDPDDETGFQRPVLHREDGPAEIKADGTRYWYRNGILHREDGPAIEYAAGGVEWVRMGRTHRIDGPALISACGTYLHWCEDGIAVLELHFDKAEAEKARQFHTLTAEAARQALNLGPDQEHYATPWNPGRK